ncbi:MAG: hypothetical protein ACLQDY_28085 [Streptosporangiaceae bacterium]
MDPISLIVAALAAGAAAGVQGTAASAVRDAYAGLKALVKKRFAGRPDAELILARHERAPQTWQAPLAAELSEARADRDPDLVAAAQALMDLVERAGSRTENYNVDARGSQGAQIGGHGNISQGNIYNLRPGG